MQDKILVLQEYLSNAVEKGDTGAVYALLQLKELSEMCLDLEFRVEVAEKAIDHGC